MSRRRLSDVDTAALDTFLPLKNPLTSDHPLSLSLLESLLRGHRPWRHADYVLGRLSILLSTSWLIMYRRAQAFA